MDDKKDFRDKANFGKISLNIKKQIPIGFDVTYFFVILA